MVLQIILTTDSRSNQGPTYCFGMPKPWSSARHCYPSAIVRAKTIELWAVTAATYPLPRPGDILIVRSQRSDRRSSDTDADRRWCQRRQRLEVILLKMGLRMTDGSDRNESHEEKTGMVGSVS